MRLSLENVCFSYEKKKILDNVSILIEDNAWVGLVGANGSGKSSLVRVIGDLVKYEGSVVFDGKKITEDNRYDYLKKIGIVFDEFNWEKGTVREVLSFSLINLGWDKDKIDNRVEELAEMFEIYDFLEDSLGSVSKSIRQVVLLVSSLVHEPELIILDDSFGDMTISWKKKVLRVLKNYKKKNKISILMITNDLDDVLVCDRLIVLDRGCVCLNDTVIKVFKQEERLTKAGISLPFVVRLSFRLWERGIVEHLYLSMEKLVDDIWK